jgi:hypothetical protein
MQVGYIIASNEVMLLHKPIGFFYREEPGNEQDSGWRFFSGDETEVYMEEPKNFAMYNATTIIAIDPSIVEYLEHEYPVAFERDEASGKFIEVGFSFK